MQLSQALLSLALAVAFLAAPAPAQTWGPSVSFDPPESVATSVMGINASGTVVGYYYDEANHGHGYVRDPAGGIATFDAPGSIGTFPQSIDKAGSVTGSYEDSNQNYYGFVRDAAGVITEFNPTGSLFATPTSINSKGTITGYESTGGFVRYPDGAIDTFSGLRPLAINDFGLITGAEADGPKAFVRDQSGQTRLFNGPAGSRHTTGTSINDAGVITGYYELDNIYSPFVRDVGGTFTSFGMGDGIDTFLGPYINAQGYIIGTYCLRTATFCDWYGFVREPGGTILPYVDFPGSVATFLSGMNASGMIAGAYQDTNTRTHGFVEQFQPR